MHVQQGIRWYYDPPYKWHVYKMRLLKKRMIKETCRLTVKSCKLFCSQTTGTRWQNVWWDCCSNISNSMMVGCQFWSETLGFHLVKASFGVHSSWFWTRFEIEQFGRNLHKQLASARKLYNPRTHCSELTFCTGIPQFTLLIWGLKKKTLETKTT